jgi:hypothetical protein
VKRTLWLVLLALMLVISYPAQAHGPEEEAVIPITPPAPVRALFYGGTPRAVAAYESWSVPLPWPLSLDDAAPAALPGAAWNMELVGHHNLDGLGWWGGLGLADACAYVGSYALDSLQIVDVSDPRHPAVVGAVPLPADAQPVELRALPERDLLVVADEHHARLYTFDIGVCAAPRLLGSHALPGAPHEFFLWHDGAQVLAYATLFDESPPDLVVVDLTDPAAPREVGRWTARDEGAAGILHSVSVSPAGDRAYLALWEGGLLVAEVDLPDIRLVRDGQNRFAPAVAPHTHSAVPLGEARYAILAAEVFTCPFEGLSLVDLADPGHPEIVSEYLLPENRCADLPAGGPTFTPHNPTTVGGWVLASWYGAGVQVIDWRDRLNPQRVGQFVPSSEGAAPRSLLGEYPVQSFSYPILRDGLIYFTDSSSGLYIVRYTGPGASGIEDVRRAEGNLTVRS